VKVRWRAALAGALILIGGQVFAQDPQESRGAPAGEFDFYVLALSWSPGFCAASASARNREQCGEGGPAGFVVHGLWPQYESGYPAYCEPGGRSVSRPALEGARELFPDEDLARHQWRKHGTCSGESPAGYLRAVRDARELVRMPDRLERPATDTKVLALEIERAFAQANRGLRADMMAVECGRRLFQEIRICLTKDLRGFRACPEVDRAGCRAGEITVHAVQQP
jgi:ribonuclease T2